MDQSSHVEFVRQTKSKAIPILNPESREKLSILAVPIPPSSFPASLYPSTRDFSSKSRPIAPRQTKAPPNNELKETSGSETLGQTFNVYARPFVPETLTIINRLDGRSLDTPPAARIDFGAYIRRYFGFEFLPAIPKPGEIPANAPISPADGVVHTKYEQYFGYHLEKEIQSQQQENESYSLYGHDTIKIFDEPGQLTTCSFLIPGLQENSPYVEEDDVIQLRELLYDHLGRPLGMEQWLALRSQAAEIEASYPAIAHRWRGEPAPGWTGIIYNARVTGVLRRQEQLLVRVCDLKPEDVKHGVHRAFSGKHHPKFNIQFPVPRERYFPMQQVLPIIQAALRHNNGSITPYQDTNGAMRTALTTFSKY